MRLPASSLAQLHAVQISSETLLILQSETCLALLSEDAIYGARYVSYVITTPC